MRTLLIGLVVLVVVLPDPAQLAVLALLRSVPAEVWLGFIGASLAAPMWIAVGVNALANQLYHEDVAKAEEALRRRRR